MVIYLSNPLLLGVYIFTLPSTLVWSYPFLVLLFDSIIFLGFHYLFLELPLTQNEIPDFQQKGTLERWKGSQGPTQRTSCYLRALTWIH